MDKHKRELARLGLPIGVDAFVAIAKALDADNPGCTVRHFNGFLIIEAIEFALDLEPLDTADPTLLES